VDPRRALSFGAAADLYARARPSYPVEAVQLCLPAGCRRVLDLGAGTGKLTSVLLDLGLEVVAVEPDDAMRAHVDPRAIALAGTAEDVPVPDASVDAVLVGQAWHWFSRPEALASVRRVVRPGGTLGLLWNLLDDSSGWWAEVADLAGMEDRLSLMPPGETRPDPEEDGMGLWRRALVPHEQQADAAAVVASIASRSAVLLRPEPERQALLDAVRALLPAGSFAVPWVTDTWVATLPEG
jgi:SAM-dependent methyltransferase